MPFVYLAKSSWFLIVFYQYAMCMEEEEVVLVVVHACTTLEICWLFSLNMLCIAFSKKVCWESLNQVLKPQLRASIMALFF